MEKQKESIEVSVARCSEGNMLCKRAFVRTCKASSPIEEIKPPKAMTRYKDECSAKIPASTKNVDTANIRL